MKKRLPVVGYRLSVEFGGGVGFTDNRQPETDNRF